MAKVGDRNDFHVPDTFYISTGDAVRMVNEWTEEEAINSWFFLCGMDSKIVSKVNDHVMRMREILAPGSLHPSVLEDTSRTGAADSSAFHQFVSTTMPTVADWHECEYPETCLRESGHQTPEPTFGDD